MDEKRYSLCAFSLTIQHSKHEEFLRITKLWEKLFAASCAVDSAAGTDVKLQFLPDVKLLRVDPAGKVVCDSGGLRVLQTKKGFRLSCESSMLDLDLSRGVALGYLSPAFWTLPAVGQRSFLLLSFVMLARRRGCYALHANGVVSERRACLIVGNSGCGKTTLSLNLIRQNWDYVSDDVIVLRRNGQGIEAMSVNRAFSCTAETATHFAELTASVCPKQEKSLLYLDGIYDCRLVSPCRPALVLFPSVTQRCRSQLVPVAPAIALTSLIHYSVGIMVDNEEAARHLEVLKDLVRQAQSFRFLAGTDVYDDPERIPGLIRQAQRG